MRCHFSGSLFHGMCKVDHPEDAVVSVRYGNIAAWVREGTLADRCLSHTRAVVVHCPPCSGACATVAYTIGQFVQHLTGESV
jgi:hypothetical protein